MSENVLSTHAMYAIFTTKGEMLGVHADFPEVDKYLADRASKVPEGKLEMLKLARLSIDAHQLALLLMAKANLAAGEGIDIVVLSSGWFARPDFTTWYHKVPKVDVVPTKAE